MSNRELRMNFLKAAFIFFYPPFPSPPPPFFLGLTGWQVKLGAKDVQGSAWLSKCLFWIMQWSQRGWGGGKVVVGLHTLPCTFRRGIQPQDGDREGFFLSDRSTHAFTAPRRVQGCKWSLVFKAVMLWPFLMGAVGILELCLGCISVASFKHRDGWLTQI